MLNRVISLLIVVLFVVMNVLLIRSEFGRNPLHSPISTAMVWQKILTAPDNSSLEILHHGKRIGNCTWAPNVGEEMATGKISSDTPPPEGMVKQLTGYSIAFEGNLGLEDYASRLRFDFVLKLSTNHAWQEFTTKLNLRPSTWELRAVAVEERVRLRIEDTAGKTEHVFTFAELQNPESIVREFGGPFLPEVLEAMGLPLRPGRLSATNGPAALSLGLEWVARNDWLKVGHEPMRVFRLQARLLGSLQMLIYVSPVGEILRVELPDEIVLVNRLDGLADLEPLPP
ncbi:MAG TPA: hypothetical protein VGK40_09280 [Verrucomicrobiae bacterium]|jgi:hypothetical protein